MIPFLDNAFISSGIRLLLQLHDLSAIFDLHTHTITGTHHSQAHRTYPSTHTLTIVHVSEKTSNKFQKICRHPRGDAGVSPLRPVSTTKLAFGSLGVPEAPSDAVNGLRSPKNILVGVERTDLAERSWGEWCYRDSGKANDGRCFSATALSILPSGIGTCINYEHVKKTNMHVHLLKRECPFWNPEFALFFRTKIPRSVSSRYRLGFGAVQPRIWH